MLTTTTVVAPGFPLVIGVLMTVCAVLFVVVCLRRWSLPVWGAVVIALAVRLAVVALSYGHTPTDVAVFFKQAGELVLSGHEPATTLPRFDWNFLPLMPYVYALQIRTGLPWELGGKIAPVIADVVIVALLSRLAPRRHAGTVPLLYALCPLAILVSAEHAQVEPVAVALGIGGLLLARRNATVRAGLLAGLAVASKTWPVLLVIGMLRETPWQRWWRLVLPLVAVLAVLLASVKLFLHSSLSAFVHVLTSYRSFLGVWGWSGILQYFHIAGFGFGGPNIDRFQTIGTVVMVVAMIVVIAVFWRSGAVTLTAAILLTYLIVTPGFGAQYLLWPIPFLLALRRASSLVFVMLASCYAALDYLVALPSSHPYQILPWMQWLSLPIIASALVALVALRRKHPDDNDEPPAPESEPATSDGPETTAVSVSTERVVHG